MRVFVSHSSKDKPAVEALARALRERGIEARLDKWMIGPGDDIVAKINDGLEQASAGLIVFSAQSRENQWVEAEVSYLPYAHIQEGKVLIPVVVGEDSYVPALLRPLARFVLGLVGFRAQAVRRFHVDFTFTSYSLHISQAYSTCAWAGLTRNEPGQVRIGQMRPREMSAVRIRRSGAPCACVLLVVVVQGFLQTPACWAQAKSRYETDMEALIHEVDRSYPFFDLKGIRSDWGKCRTELLRRAKTCASDQEFLELLLAAGKSLRDAHLGPRNFKVEVPPRPPMYYPGISFLPATNDRVVVMHPRGGMDPKINAGTVVTKIDGQDARQVLEARSQAAWKEGGHFSSPQRARLYEFRIPLRTEERGQTHKITCIVGDKTQEIELSADIEARGWPHTYNRPPGLKRVGRSGFHTQLPSGVGYIYLSRVDNSVEPCITQAIAAHPNVKGWVVDLRGNGGGGYGRSLVRKLQALRKPVACLIDAGCMSAGETLARDIVSTTQARLFGAKTAGASSAKRVWNFPSGIGSMSFPTRSRGGIGGKPIEYNGIAPHVEVEAVPEELQRGLNSAVLRGEEYIAGTPAGP